MVIDPDSTLAQSVHPFLPGKTPAVGEMLYGRRSLVVGLYCIVTQRFVSAIPAQVPTHPTLPFAVQLAIHDTQ